MTAVVALERPAVSEFFLPLMAACLLAASTLNAAGAAGESAANILTLAKSVRSGSMGGVSAAHVTGIDALYGNPAGLGWTRHFEFGAMGWRGLGDFSQDDLSVALPMSGARSANIKSFGTFGFTLGELDYGTAPGTDAVGNPIGDFSARDKVMALGFGRPIGDRWSFGVLGKKYDLELAEQNADGIVADVGLAVRLVPDYMTLGVMGRNLGGGIRYAADEDDVPAQYIGGIALTPAPDRVLLAADAVFAQDDDPTFRVGGELRLSSVFLLRGGYDTAYDAGPGFSAGIGIEIRQLEFGFFPFERVLLDYGITPTDDFDYVHRASLAFHLGFL